jgi:hypothetical protein
MAYSLDALLGRPQDLRRPPHPTVFPLTPSLGLVPLTADVEGPLSPIEAWARDASRGTQIARLGAEFFGGQGGHDCTLWVDGSPETGLDINAVLARFGVAAAPPQDAFDTVGLGRFRTTEGWHAQAVVDQARDVAALLRDPRSNVRKAAVERLGDLRVLPALVDEDYGVRLAACSALERLGDPGRRALEQGLSTASPADLWGILFSLGRMGPGARLSAPAVAPLLQHPDEKVRAEARRALGLIGAP